ncbi:hypothetical protein I302_102978 [Kwoniella bestiolae CBS 10118]|uniref:Uncharacterized protein n=1 Tax=Kwoniella bestiolae CBS 10118 TaxID=1296100 RepID=A0A1B9GGQ9_9TREE|nr:hypothetical protein I302_01674 [Kwoniella bestiolae CBS 10118]OCF30155.1 hypothetical protein I302_01674 [Kwoniella bestiolae CBS 10118]
MSDSSRIEMSEEKGTNESEHFEDHFVFNEEEFLSGRNPQLYSVDIDSVGHQSDQTRTSSQPAAAASTQTNTAKPTVRDTYTDLLAKREKTLDSYESERKSLGRTVSRKTLFTPLYGEGF